MTTTTLFSKQSHFRQQYLLALRSHTGYFILSFLIIFLFYPMQYLMEIFKKLPEGFMPSVMADGVVNPYGAYNLYGMGRNFTGASMVIFSMVFLLFPFVLALMTNSYMHSKKAADVYHSLPVRRETLLLVNTAVSMTILTVSLVVSNVIIAIAAFAKFGAVAPIGMQFLDMFAWLASAFLIYAITVCVCTQVGTAFDTFFFSGICFGILPLILLTFIMLGQMFLYGFSEGNNIKLYELMTFLSPVVFPIFRLSFSTYTYQTEGISFRKGGIPEETLGLITRSNWGIVLYFVVAAALICFAMRLYSRRHSETAETTTSKGMLPTAVQSIATVLSGIFIGFLFYASSYPEKQSTFLIWCTIGALISFCIQEVILNRGFKTLLKRLPVGGALTALALVISGSVMTGFFGYENRVPSLDTLKSVHLNWIGNYTNTGSIAPSDNIDIVLTDPAAMQTVLDYHKAVTEEKFVRNETPLEDEGKIPARADILLKYNRTGLPLTREYNISSSDTLLKLVPLELHPEFQKTANPFFQTVINDTMEWEISDAFGWSTTRKKLSPEENTRLLEAVQADFLELTPESALHPSSNVVAYLSLLQSPKFYEKDGRARATRYYHESGKMPLSVAITEGKALRVLRELNMLPDAPDLSKCIGVKLTLSAPRTLVPDGTPYQELLSNSQIIQFKDSMSWRSGSIASSMINRIFSASDSNGRSVFESMKEDQKRQLEELRRESEDFGMDTYTVAFERDTPILSEDRALIEAFAKNLAPTWQADEPLLYVDFYTEDMQAKRRTSIVPLSKLPVDMQEQVYATYAETFAVIAAANK